MAGGVFFIYCVTTLQGNSTNYLIGNELMKLAKILGALLLASVLSGCGTGPAENPVDVTPPSATEMLRTTLNELAASGQPMGSGGQTLGQYIEEIMKSDPAKGQKLQEGLDSLMTLQQPAQIKAKANEMLQAL